MSKTQIIIYGLFLTFEIFGIATIVELYKKELRHDKSTTLENYIVGGLLSALGVFLLYFLHIFKPILGEIGGPLWADYVLYFTGFFFLQKTTDMKLIKKLIKTRLKALLITYGFSADQVEEILNQKKA